MATKSNRINFSLFRTFSKGISALIPPPGFIQLTPRASENEELNPRAVENDELTSTRLTLMLNYMISNENLADFKEMISLLDRIELKTMVALLTSKSNVFTEIISTKNGSKRVQILLGKSEEIQTFFHEAITQNFLQIMTDKHARNVAIKAMNLFNRQKKTSLYQKTLCYAIDLACNEHGCVSLNAVITDCDNTHYKSQLRDLIAENAFLLSFDPWGNFVIQHALTLNDVRCRCSIAFHLRGKCVELSFLKHGSYIVEKLLEVENHGFMMSMLEVVNELILGCNGETLMRLARHEYGNFVVRKALMGTLELEKFDLFLSLYWKLVPFIEPLRMSRWSRRIVIILEYWIPVLGLAPN